MDHEHGHLIRDGIIFYVLMRVLGPFRWILVFGAMYLIWCALDIVGRKEDAGASTGQYAFHVVDSETHVDPDNTEIRINYQVKNLGSGILDQVTLRARLYDCPTEVITDTCEAIDQKVEFVQMEVKSKFRKEGYASFSFNHVNPKGVYVTRVDAPKAEFDPG